MSEIWHPLEFEHPSGIVVHIIDVPSGVELFAVEVFQIIFPDVEAQEIEKYEIEITRRSTWINNKIVMNNTMCASAIFSLARYTDIKRINQFAQWVRNNILAGLKSSIIYQNRLGYPFKTIDYSSKESLLSYLVNKSNVNGLLNERVVDLYLRFIHKKIPLSVDCPLVKNVQTNMYREQYLQIVENLLKQQQRYEHLYHDLVLSTPDLLMAQELDVVVFVALKKLKQTDSILETMKQGLVLQALDSVVNNISRFSDLRHIEPFYLRLLEHFQVKYFLKESGIGKN